MLVTALRISRHVFCKHKVKELTVIFIDWTKVWKHHSEENQKLLDPLMRKNDAKTSRRQNSHNFHDGNHETFSFEKYSFPEK